MDRKILIVDDEKNIVDIIAFNLKKEGYTVITAADGEEGVQKAMEENPDLILLDIMMPKMDGYEVCKKIREKKNTPIIMLTARAEELDKVLGLELGAKDGRIIDLTVREFELLKYLSAQKGQVFSRETLLEKVWGYEYFGDVRTVDVTIRRLREKIEDDPGKPVYILTKRGVGYYFDC